MLSRRERSPAAPAEAEWAVGDLLTGDGLPEAVTGVSAVVHCASDPRKPDDDLDAAVQLLLAARAAGVPHLVYVSIVGVDRVPYAYYKAKHRVEEIVEDGGVPWTILRATQFHEFVATLLDYLSRGPVALAPAGMSDQPVDVREVASRLVELVAAGPSGRVEDLGGPQVLTVTELMRTYLAAKGRRRPRVDRAVPRAAERVPAGHHLTPAHATGRLTFAEWAQSRSSLTVSRAPRSSSRPRRRSGRRRSSGRRRGRRRRTGTTSPCPRASCSGHCTVVGTPVFSDTPAEMPDSMASVSMRPVGSPAPSPSPSDSAARTATVTRIAPMTTPTSDRPSAHRARVRPTG